MTSPNMAVSSSKTIVAQLTPHGRGAIAVVGVYGHNAGNVIRRLCPALVGSLAPGSFRYTKWTAGAGDAAANNAAEDVIVGQLGQDHFEVHCHGGVTAAEAIVQSLVDAGCHVSAWQDFIGQLTSDEITKAACLALANARTERVAAILLDQHAGAMKTALVEIVALLHEENAPAAAERLTALCDRGSLGKHLASPWRITLAGPPNVGKSSLINAIVGFERAIVFDLPGTTRDVVTVNAAIDGWPIELADTAGLHDALDPLEATGIERARQRLAESDLIVLVFDGSAPWNAESQALVEAWPHAIRVLNKCDLPTAEPPCPVPTIAASARSGECLQELLAEISRQLVPNPPAIGEAVPLSEQQLTAIGDARALVEQGQLLPAISRLQTLLG